MARNKWRLYRVYRVVTVANCQPSSTTEFSCSKKPDLKPTLSKIPPATGLVARFTPLDDSHVDMLNNQKSAHWSWSGGRPGIYEVRAVQELISCRPPPHFTTLIICW
ncbi:hypothetical protein LZ30DRAFT_687951 [Colletotrichum cereale]|nr:hypothetical protein LZ30DRAFT_687951 [Colletotrichum cereale]